MVMHRVTGWMASLAGRSAMVALEAAWLSLLFAGCVALVDRSFAAETLVVSASLAGVFALCAVLTVLSVVLGALRVAATVRTTRRR